MELPERSRYMRGFSGNTCLFLFLLAVIGCTAVSIGIASIIGRIAGVAIVSVIGRVTGVAIVIVVITILVG